MSATALDAEVGTEFAQSASLLAARLVSLAVFDGDGHPTWTGDDVDPRSAPDLSTPPTLVHVRLDDGLLTGRAGIAVALAACARLPGAPSTWVSLAALTARAAVRRAGHGLVAEPPSAGLGWDSGAFGIARAGVVVAAAADDPPLAAASRRLAGVALQRVLRHPDELPPWPDLLGGVAGVLMGALTAPLETSEERQRDEVVQRLVTRLDEMSLDGPLGRRWLMATADHSVVGLAHGGSGIALALTLAARHLRQRSDLEPAAAGAERLAAEAVLWEAGQHDAAAGGWPDLRVPERPPALAWCHGAPGVGVVAALRIAGSRRPGSDLDAETDPAAYIAFGRARAALEGRRPASGQPFDGSLCHGLSGVVEMHLLAAQVWPESGVEHLAAARSLATRLTRAGEPGRAGWTCGIPTGGRSPNVLVGIAGVALTLARCHDPSVSPSAADPSLGTAFCG